MTIQTHPDVTRDLRQATRQGLQPTRGSGWLAGFGNMLTKELGEWFHTRRWLWQLLLWMIIINGFVVLILFILPLLESLFPGINASLGKSYEGLPPEAMGLSYYFSISILTGSIGVIILAQDEIIQEKQSGTIAWILSKPAARPAFILTKLLSNSIGVLIFIVAIPALVFLGEIYLDLHIVIPLVPFLAGLGVFLLALIFYLTLVIMLGVLFESRGPVMGIAFGILIGGNVISSFIPQIAYVLPVTMESIAQSVVLGTPMPVMFNSQLISAAILSSVFILVALWRFQREEF
ncbi:MAG: ABC transporter permease [Chloroflexota bacterium]|nr:MAG: ABC transporter permease [Chloroflexota bacterium]